MLALVCIAISHHAPTMQGVTGAQGLQGPRGNPGDIVSLVTTLKSGLDFHAHYRDSADPVAPLVRRGSGDQKEKTAPRATPAEQDCQERKETTEFPATVGQLDKLGLL